VLRSSALIVLLFTARILAAADPPFAAYVPADTRVLTGIEVRAILDSEWGKSAIELAKSSNGDAWAKQTSFHGIDLLKDIDEVWIVSSSVDQKAQALAIVRGRFDKSHLPAAIGRYHGVPLIPMDAKREQLLAIMDDSTMFAGDRMSVQRAIDRHGLKSVNPRLAASASALHARYWIWAVADDLNEAVASKPMAQGLDAVNSFEFGLALNHDLEAVAQLHMRTAQDAQKMLASMAMIEAMAKGQQDGASQIHIVSRVTDKTLDVSLRVPEYELKQAWEQQRAAIAQRLTQLPEQIAAARAGKPFQLSVAPAPAHAAASAQAAPAPSRKSRVVSDEDGNTVQLTLPGR